MSDQKVLAMPDRTIKPLPSPLPGDLFAAAERDVHQACADIMLAAKELQTVDEVLAVQRRIVSMRAALDSAASFVLTQGDLLTK
jgi:hypothetical protein